MADVEWIDLARPDAGRAAERTSGRRSTRARSSSCSQPRAARRRAAADARAPRRLRLRRLPRRRSPSREEDRVYYQEIDIVAHARAARSPSARRRRATSRTTSSASHASCDADADDAAGHDASTASSTTIAERYLDLIDASNDEIDELEDHVEDWPAAQVRARISGAAARPPARPADARADARCRPRGRRRPGRARRGGEAASRARSSSHFADAYDKLLRATDGLELSRDLSPASATTQAKIANDQNEVMKRLTAIASILLVPTFIVGLYGQNFRPHPRAALGLRLRVVVGADHRRRRVVRSSGLLPAEAAGCSSAVGAGTTLDRACRTSSARTARSARSTTTGARA